MRGAQRGCNLGHGDSAKEVGVTRNGKETVMLSWAITFLIIAIIAAVFGFGGIAGTAAGIAKILFFIFLILFVVSLLFGRGRGTTV
jgi:uncharacterized membrane protein YtjA (UPF0391 family)